MGDARPGDNLYTNSTIALDADTGELRSHYQSKVASASALTLSDPPHLGKGAALLSRFGFSIRIRSLRASGRRRVLPRTAREPRRRLRPACGSTRWRWRTRRCSKRNATPSTVSFTATTGSARCCSIRTSATPSCGPDCCQPCRRPSCAKTSPTWRTGRGATARRASSRPPSGTRG